VRRPGFAQGGIRTTSQSKYILPYSSSQQTVTFVFATILLAICFGRPALVLSGRHGRPACNIKWKTWAPPACCAAAGSPYRLGLGPQVPDRLCAYGAGRPALRSGAPAGPAWRGAKSVFAIRQSWLSRVRSYVFFCLPPSATAPTASGLGRLLLSEPGILFRFCDCPCRVSSQAGPEAVGQAGTAGAARRSRGASLQRPPWSGVPGGDPPDSEHAEACSHDGS